MEDVGLYRPMRERTSSMEQSPRAGPQDGDECIYDTLPLYPPHLCCI